MEQALWGIWGFVGLVLINSWECLGTGIWANSPLNLGSLLAPQSWGFTLSGKAKCFLVQVGCCGVLRLQILGQAGLRLGRGMGRRSGIPRRNQRLIPGKNNSRKGQFQSLNLKHCRRMFSRGPRRESGILKHNLFGLRCDRDGRGVTEPFLLGRGRTGAVLGLWRTLERGIWAWRGCGQGAQGVGVVRDHMNGCGQRSVCGQWR